MVIDGIDLKKKNTKHKRKQKNRTVKNMLFTEMSKEICSSTNGLQVTFCQKLGPSSINSSNKESVNDNDFMWKYPVKQAVGLRLACRHNLMQIQFKEEPLYPQLQK